MTDPAVIVALVALLISIFGQLFISGVTIWNSAQDRKVTAEREKNERADKLTRGNQGDYEKRREARLRFLRYSLKEIIKARGIAGFMQAQNSPYQPDSMAIAQALAQARGVAYSIGDQQCTDSAGSIAPAREESALDSIDVVIERIGQLIAELTSKQS